MRIRHREAVFGAGANVQEKSREESVLARPEIEIKQALVRDLLESLSLDGVYIKRQSNFAWLTAGGKNMVPIATEIGVSGALITRDGAYIVCNVIEAPRTSTIGRGSVTTLRLPQ